MNKKYKRGKYSNGFINHLNNQWYAGDGTGYKDCTHFIDELGGIIDVEYIQGTGRGYWDENGTFRKL